MPKAENRPTIPLDFNMHPHQEKMVINIILDGQILKENLNYSCNDELWLQKQIVSLGYNNASEIFLATCDYNNNLQIYPKKDYNNSHDIFE